MYYKKAKTQFTVYRTLFHYIMVLAIQEVNVSIKKKKSISVAILRKIKDCLKYEI
jgi:hypothetical protein